MRRHPQFALLIMLTTLVSIVASSCFVPARISSRYGDKYETRLVKICVEKDCTMVVTVNGKPTDKIAVSGWDHLYLCNHNPYGVHVRFSEDMVTRGSDVFLAPSETFRTRVRNHGDDEFEFEIVARCVDGPSTVDDGDGQSTSDDGPPEDVQTGEYDGGPTKKGDNDPDPEEEGADNPSPM